MNQRDIDNYETIGELVNKYFWLNNESKDRFNEAIEKKDLYIDDTTRKFLGEDLRMRVDVNPDSEAFGKVDSSWASFKAMFSNFYAEKGINYQNFKTNKFIDGGQERKLFKSIKKFYLGKEVDAAKKVDLLRTLGRIFDYDFDYSFQREETRQRLDNELEEAINEAFEKIGASKAPNKNLQLVMSANFADWMMCSTAENWGSCLNLDSNFEECYWSGLPGTIVDKNRVMFYLTDGQEKEKFGIRTDKFISRSWGILTGKERYKLIKFYPNNFFDERSLNSIYEENNIYVPFHEIDREEYEPWKSKHEINFLEDCSFRTLFPYIDLSDFRGTTRATAYMVESCDGGFYYFDGYEKNQDSIYRYGYGLTGLIKHNENLSEYEYHGLYCEECGDSICEDTAYHAPNGYVYCESCFGERYFYCDCCEEIYDRDEMCVVNFENLCENCFNENYTICSECGEPIELNSIYHTDDNGNVYCEDCFEYRFAECEHCSTVYPRDELDGNFICKNCADEYYAETNEEGNTA